MLRDKEGGVGQSRMVNDRKRLVKGKLEHGKDPQKKSQREIQRGEGMMCEENKRPGAPGPGRRYGWGAMGSAPGRCSDLSSRISGKLGRLQLLLQPQRQ